MAKTMTSEINPNLLQSMALEYNYPHEDLLEDEDKYMDKIWFLVTDVKNAVKSTKSEALGPSRITLRLVKKQENIGGEENPRIKLLLLISLLLKPGKTPQGLVLIGYFL